MEIHCKASDTKQPSQRGWTKKEIEEDASFNKQGLGPWLFQMMESPTLVTITKDWTQMA